VAPAQPPASLAAGVVEGDVRSVARALTLVESERTPGEALIGRIFRRTGRALVVGVTGPPGAGKSSLVDRMTALLRQSGRRVGIIAVDPSSPFTGGALLGDRIRMQAHAGDAGVFIRSMATRGHLGGLSAATGDAVLVLDAAGYDPVIVETVGVGQDEVDIARAADVSIVVLAPGAGDDVQALKAGLMEIADIFVVNKADRDGADRTAAEIEAMLGLRPAAAGEWRPPVIRTVATTGDGVPALAAAIERWRGRTAAARDARRVARADAWLRATLGRRFVAHLEQNVLGSGELAAAAKTIASRDLDPYEAVRRLFERGVAGEAREPR
jgi:LAO/AO transport system kinase